MGRRILRRPYAAGLALLVVVTAGGPSPARASSVIDVQGEDAARTNVGVAKDPRASGRSYLALASARRPPKGGWYATYRVKAPAPGVYRLQAVATSPVERHEDAKVGSYVNLSVNGSPYTQVAWSQPRWARYPRVWGDLYGLGLGDVELRRGTNTLTFMVNEPVVVEAAVLYRFLLDRFWLTPVKVALQSVYVQDPRTTLGVIRSGERAAMHFRLNGRAPATWRVGYDITDYYSAKVATGSLTIPKGSATASVVLPRLRPGHYTVSAWPLASPWGTRYRLLRPATGATAGEWSRQPVRRQHVRLLARAVVPARRLCERHEADGRRIRTRRRFMARRSAQARSLSRYTSGPCRQGVPQAWFASA